MTYQPRINNLLRDGYERVAENLSARIRHRKGTFACYVKRDGRVLLPETSEANRTPMPPDEELVAIYNCNARVEHIEDDLLVRLRELTT